MDAAKLRWMRVVHASCSERLHVCVARSGKRAEMGGSGQAVICWQGEVGMPEDMIVCHCGAAAAVVETVMSNVWCVWSVRCSASCRCECLRLMRLVPGAEPVVAVVLGEG